MVRTFTLSRSTNDNWGDLQDIFVAVVTSATEVGNTRPSGSTPESVARIHEVCFYSLTSSAWDDLAAGPTDPTPDRSDGSEPSNSRDIQSSTPPLVPVHPCLPLTKLLASGSFYYSMNPMWDISSRLAVRLSRRRGESDIEAFDDRFVWNEHIIRSLLDFRERLDPDERADLDVCQFLVRSSALWASSIIDLKDPIKILAIQGYVGIFTMALPAPPTDGAPTIATLSLISRLGWRRAGTRFNTRGVDDDGNCANFAEAGLIFKRTTFYSPSSRRRQFSAQTSIVSVTCKSVVQFPVRSLTRHGFLVNE